MYTNGHFEFALSLVPLPLWLIVTIHRKHRLGANLLGLKEFKEIQIASNARAAAALSVHGHLFLHLGSGAKTFTSLQIGAEKDSKDPCMEDDGDGKD